MNADTDPRRPHKALGPLNTDTLAGVIAAASSTGYEDWWGRVRSSGYCAHPIHLTRTHLGYTTTVYARCENRRETVCPACSDLYALDTWHIVTQGLTPERMTSATAVFVTLTAPSFGPVHTPASDTGRPCRPGRPRTCDHGRPATCHLLHAVSDPQLGQPLCGDCYDYETHVLTTWWFPALWKRYVLALRRLLARRAPGTRVSFVKVMEMQTRLAPHYHAIIRTDTADTTDTLEALAALAASTAHLDVPTPHGTRTLRFGTQVDVQPLAANPHARRVAGYLAKYVTKNITAAPLPARIAPASIALLPIPAHHKHLMRALVTLATDLPEHYAGMTDRLGTLGWRGHTTTKSRTYSTTMTAQKQHRADWRAAHTPTIEDANDHGDVEWEYQSSGHKSTGHRYLAVTAALTHRERIRTAHTANDTTTLSPTQGTSP